MFGLVDLFSMISETVPNSPVCLPPVTRTVAPTSKGYTSTISCSGTFKQITSPTE